MGQPSHVAAALGDDSLRAIVIDEAAAHAAFAHITSLEVWADIVKDEERLFDRTHEGWAIGGVIDIEHETNLSSPTFETNDEAAKAQGK